MNVKKLYARGRYFQNPNTVSKAPSLWFTTFEFLKGRFALPSIEQIINKLSMKKIWSLLILSLFVCQYTNADTFNLLACLEVKDAVYTIDGVVDPDATAEDLYATNSKHKVETYRLPEASEEAFTLHPIPYRPTNADKNIKEGDIIYTLKIRKPALLHLYNDGIKKTSSTSRLLKAYTRTPHGHNINAENGWFLMTGQGVPLNTESFDPNDVIWQLMSIQQDPEVLDDPRYQLGVLRLTLYKREFGQGRNASYGYLLMKCRIY